VLAALCYAVAAVFVRRTLRGVPSLTIALYSLICAAIEVLALSLIFSPPPITTMTPKVWLAVVWLGLLGSGLAYVFAYFILEHWGASRYTLLTYVLPVIGLALGALFLGEVIDWHIIAGSLLVLAGIVLATIASGRKTGARTATDPKSSPDRTREAVHAGE
ncbi:MAG TPA: DMT family transporter, partial [Chloroflexota bacterium]